MKPNLIGLLLALALVAAVDRAFAATTPDAATAETWAQLKNDALTVCRARNDLTRTILFMQRSPELFPPKRLHQPPALSREQRLAIWGTWQAFLDPMVRLDRIVHNYNALYRDADGDLKKSAFRLAFAAMLAQYRHALDFIDLTENNPDLHTVLNEPVVELGLPARTYARLKFRFLNILLATEFARLNVIYRYYGADAGSPVHAGLEEDNRIIWQAGKGRGPLQTGENALQILKDASFSAWLPLQKGVSEWMGDTKVWRWKKSLISPQQVSELQSRLEPGDVMLVRHEWYLSNLGLPGFWPHAALYIGTPEQRRIYFQDQAVTDWVRREQAEAVSLDDLLQKRYRDVYQAFQTEPRASPLPRVIESVSEGVIFTTLPHCLNADSAAVLRPRLPKVEKARAILRAFHYSGRPYDFNFDFLTDAELVCTELVFKSYEPAKEMTGLRLPLVTIAGRQLLPANNIARLFAREYGTAGAQFDFVLFLDGHEQEGVAVPADVAAFLTSYKRPKWHILIQGDMRDTAPGP